VNRREASVEHGVKVDASEKTAAQPKDEAYAEPKGLSLARRGDYVCSTDYRWPAAEAQVITISGVVGLASLLEHT
jgi:hypothetical protein